MTHAARPTSVELLAGGLRRFEQAGLLLGSERRGTVIVVQVGPNQTVTLLESDQPGCVNHIYLVIGFNELTDYRDAILRCYWDGETTPSVEVPLGDFFALAHGRVRTFDSRFTAVNPGDGSRTG